MKQKNVFDHSLSSQPLKEANKQIRESDIPARGIKQRHCEAWLIFSGLATDIPDGSSHVKAYFATDTNTLYLWNGTAWVSELFT